VKKQILIGLGKYLFGFLVLGLVLWWYWEPSGSKPGIKDVLSRPVRVASLIAAGVLYFIGLLGTFLRWFLLVRAQDLPFRVPDALRLGFIGYFFNTFLPGSIGGDVIKAAGIAREQSRRTVAVATVIVDRGVGLWGLMWLAALCGGMFWLLGNQAIVDNANLRWVFFIALSSSVLSYLVWFLLGFLPTGRADIFAGRLEGLPGVGHSVAELWRAIWMYRCRGRSVFLAVVMSLVCHVFFVLAFYFAAHVFEGSGEAGQIPSLTEHWLLVPVGMTIEAVPLTPGGVGVAEGVYGWLYSLAGAPEANGIFAMLSKRVINYGLALIGYFIFLRMRATLKPALAPEIPPESDPEAQPALA
jgi:uncharacterized membrane protein YbhN (UPF0104 family)